MQKAELPCDFDINHAIESPLIVGPHTPVTEVITLMSQVRGSQCNLLGHSRAEISPLFPYRGASSVLVMGDEKLLGIITQKDLVKLAAMGINLKGVLISEVMTTGVITLKFDDFKDIFNALSLMRQYKIRHLPILKENSEVVGLVTPESLCSLLRSRELFKLRRVEEVMTRDVTIAPPSNSILDIAQLMLQHQVNEIVIVSGNNEPKGIVTEGDILQFQALELNLANLPVTEVMSSPLFCVNSQDSLGQIQEEMQRLRVQRLIVKDEHNKLLGMVSQSHLLQMLDPVEMYDLLSFLQRRLSEVEKEKCYLLESRKIELECEVKARTEELQLKIEQERLLNGISSRIRSSLDLSEILEATVKEVRQFLHCDRVCIYQFYPDWSGRVVAESVLPGKKSLLGETVYDPCFSYDWVQPYTNGRLRVVSDIYQTKMTVCHREFLEELQMRAKMVIPILPGDNLWGLLIANECNIPRDWEIRETELMQQLSTHLAIAILHADAMAKTKKKLEERQIIEANLRANEERLRILSEETFEGIIIHSQGRILDVNSVFCRMLGYDYNELIGINVLELAAIESRTMIRQNIPSNYDDQYEAICLKKDGSKMTVEIKSKKCNYQGKPVRISVLRDITERQQIEMILQSLIQGTAATIGQEFFPVLVRNIGLTLGIRHAIISELLGDKFQTLALWSDGELQSNLIYPVQGTPCDITIKQGVYYCASGVQQAFPNDLDLRILQADTYLGIAMYNNQGDAIGVLCILDSKPLQQYQRLEGILRVFAARAAAELERQKAMNALQQLNQELEERIEQRTAELKQSEQRFDFALRNAPIIIFNQDINLRYTWIYNQALGYKVEEVIGKRDRDFMPPEAAIILTEIKQRVLNTGVRERQEIPITTEGNTQYFDLTIEPLLNETGEINGVACAALDITNVKQAEINLQKSQRFIERITETTPNIIYIYDIQEQRNIYSNREIAKILGYTSEQIKAMGAAFFVTVMHPEDLPKIFQGQQKFDRAEDEDVFEIEYRMIAANGEWRWLYSRDTVFARDAEGKVKQIIGVAQDISDRKKAELALLESESKFRVIFNSSFQFMYLFSLEGQLLDINETALKVSPINGAEMPEIKIWDSSTMFAHNSEEIKDNFRQALQGETSRFQVKAQLRSGDLIDLDASFKPLIDEKGKVYQILGEARDISEIKRTQYQLEQMNERLASTNSELARATRLKDEFLANMSHELRTPLNAVLGISEGLLDEVYGSVNEKQKKSLHTIQRSGQHLLSLINDILDLAKIEAGKIEFNISSVSPRSISDYSLSFVRQQAFNKKQEIFTEIATNIKHIKVDERRVRQVLINLLNNAVKFTPEGGKITLKVYVKEFDSQANLLFSVTDTGIGIAPEDMPKLFQSFVQIDSSISRAQDGTGLGLVLVQRIVELHGGSISVESELGKGSCFTVRLPYRDYQVDQTADIIGEHTADLSLSDSLLSDTLPDTECIKPEKEWPLILLAEDNDTNIDIISAYLLSHGYRVVVAHDGLEAIKLAKLYKPQLIIMDISMPKVDGLEATQWMRADRDLATIPIIALTAFAMPGDREKCLAAGADEYMTKPVSFQVLLYKIKQLIHR
jgi:PAS domain S-box-containing protein